MEATKENVETNIFEKVNIIVRIRPTLEGEDKKDFVQMINVSLLIFWRKNYLE